MSKVIYDEYNNIRNMEVQKFSKIYIFRPFVPDHPLTFSSLISETGG
jgi:hypothetical protein